MNNLLIIYAKIYHWYKLPISLLLQVIFIAGIVGWVVTLQSTHANMHLPIGFFLLFSIGEVLYFFKLRTTTPTLPVTQNATNNPYLSCTFQTLDSVYFAGNTKQIIKTLFQKKHVQFILQKADISLSQIPFIETKKDVLITTAFDLVKKLGGKYITRMDIFAAYLLLTDSQTRLLFNAHLKPEEFEQIVYWARIDFPNEEAPTKRKVIFWGEGIFDNITTGWTVETKKYITDITYSVLDEKPVLLGRKTEYRDMIDALLKPKRNSVMLIGETGTGKTSLVSALALNSFLGLLPHSLYHQRVYELKIGSLVAGAENMSMLETRLQSIMEEVQHAGNIILFVPELQNVLGSDTFKLDLSGALLPYLKTGTIRLIASVTPGAYTQFVEKMGSFTDVFESVRLDEPERNEAVQMLLENANAIGHIHGIALTYKAVVVSVDLAHRFMSDRALPGSAVTLLSSVSATVAGTGRKVVEEADVIAKIEEKTHVAIAAPGGAETTLLLHLEEKLQERIIGQQEAVDAISQAIRRLRSGMNSTQRPISFLFLGPTGVGKTETAKALAAIYFGGEGKTIRLDMSEYISSDSVDRLLGSAPGRGQEKGEFTEIVSQHPFSLILLDEFEKAHPEVLNLFLQVLEDGRLTDNKGKHVSFANTIIIATSNAGALFIQSELQKGMQINHAFQESLLIDIEQEHVFKPELLNRFDGIIIFKPLGIQELQQIATLYIQKFQTDMTKQDISLTIDPSVITLIAQQGQDTKFGARPLRRFIQDEIENIVARAMLEGKIIRGGTAIITTDANKHILIM